MTQGRRQFWVEVGRASWLSFCRSVKSAGGTFSPPPMLCVGLALQSTPHGFRLSARYLEPMVSGPPTSPNHAVQPIRSPLWLCIGLSDVRPSPPCSPAWFARSWLTFLVPQRATRQESIERVRFAEREPFTLDSALALCRAPTHLHGALSVRLRHNKLTGANRRCSQRSAAAHVMDDRLAVERTFDLATAFWTAAHGWLLSASFARTCQQAGAAPSNPAETN